MVVCSAPVSTDPMHDGKAHEYGHRNERREALQMGVMQQPGGTHEHVKSNENPKQSVRYSRLIAHGGWCPKFRGRRRALSLWRKDFLNADLVNEVLAT
jgi:hypothetical protein